MNILSMILMKSRHQNVLWISIVVIVFLSQTIKFAKSSKYIQSNDASIREGRSKEVLSLLENVSEVGMSYSILLCDNHTSISLANDEMNIKSEVTTVSVYNHLDVDSSQNRSVFRIGILNQQGNKLVLETGSKNNIAFTYWINCNDLHRNLNLVLSVPISKTLALEEKNANSINCASKVVPNSSLKNLSNVTKTYYNESVLLCRGRINETLIGGLIGISHIDFSLYFSDSGLFNVKPTETHTDLQESTPIQYNPIANAQAELLYSQNASQTLLETSSVEVVVLRSPKTIDTVFTGLVFAMEIVQMIALGSLLELDDFKKIIKQPLPLVTQLACHFLITTLIAYIAAKTLVSDDKLDAAGTFVMGICPSGTTTNIYAYILYGDLALSITMTLLSYLVAFGMMPFWVYTIGQEFLIGYDVIIPYMDILVMLATIVPSLLFGLLIRKRFPTYIEQLYDILTPVIILLAAGFLGTGIYANLYVFYLLDVRLTIVGCAMAFTGYILGALILLPIRRSKKLAVTMSLETGMKNTGIGYSLLINTMPPPLGDIASVVTLSAEVASQIPPFLASIFVLVREQCQKKYKSVKQNVNDSKEAIDDMKTDL